jgi:hypothetical protein
MVFEEPGWYTDAEEMFNIVVKQVAQKQGVPPSISLDSLKINQHIKDILDHIFEMRSLVKVPENHVNDIIVKKERKYQKSKKQLVKESKKIGGGKK